MGNWRRKRPGKRLVQVSLPMKTIGLLDAFNWDRRLSGEEEEKSVLILWEEVEEEDNCALTL